jgi:hypothetical protein|nr:MAG TPA: Protein of unknown function (DUF1018) [Caudoviricetes sp.]
MRLSTPAQKAKIFALSNETDIDNDTLHSLIYNLTGKDSIKKLTIMEAIKIIDKLGGKDCKSNDPKSDLLTDKQLKYIKDLASQIGYIEGSDERKLNTFVKNQYGKITYKWLSRSEACKLITAFKEMVNRKGEN